MGNGEISISVKLHMTINEINIALLIDCHEQSVFVITSDCDPMWICQMMRKKYVIMNILKECYVEDTQLQLLCGVKIK